MKARVLMPEKVELAIFDCLLAGKSVAKIAKEFDCSRETIYRLRRRGEPRWRHWAHGELHPSPALIQWHCQQSQLTWPGFMGEEHQTQNLKKPGALESPEVLLGDLEPSAEDLMAIEKEDFLVDCM